MARSNPAKRNFFASGDTYWYDFEEDGEEIGHMMVDLLHRNAWAYSMGIRAFCARSVKRAQRAVGGLELPVAMVTSSGLDLAYRSRGFGKRMYQEVLADLQGQLGPFIVVPNECETEEMTSTAALRVWKSLRCDHPTFGLAMVVGGEEY